MLLATTLHHYYKWSYIKVTTCSDRLAISGWGGNEAVRRTVCVCVEILLQIRENCHRNVENAARNFRRRVYEPLTMFWGRNNANRKLPTSTDTAYVDAVCDLIHQNRHLTIRNIAEDVGISFGSWQKNWTVLTEDQKVNRVNIGQELLDDANVVENFSKPVLKRDETWVYRDDVETKAQSAQGTSLSNLKVMLTVFFDWQAVIHYE